MPDGNRRPRALTRRRELDPYEVLQISPQASPEVIQAAYRVLARHAHPDVNSNLDSTGKMRDINAAYQLLSDPHKRAEYDARTRPVLSQRARHARASGRPAVSRPHGNVVHESVRPVAATRQSGLAYPRTLLATLTLVATIVLLFALAAWAFTDAGF